MKEAMERYIEVGAFLAATGLSFLFVDEKYLAEQTHSSTIVAITQIATHLALDEVRVGIISDWRSRGFGENENLRIIFGNARGHPSLTLPLEKSVGDQLHDFINACLKAGRRQRKFEISPKLASNETPPEGVFSRSEVIQQFA